MYSDSNTLEMSSSNISQRNSYQSCCLMTGLEVYFEMLLLEFHRMRLGNTKVMHLNCCKRNENQFLIQTGSPVDLGPWFCFFPRLFFQYSYHFLLAEYFKKIIPNINFHEQLYQETMHTKMYEIKNNFHLPYGDICT